MRLPMAAARLFDSSVIAEQSCFAVLEILLKNASVVATTALP